MLCFKLIIPEKCQMPKWAPLKMAMFKTDSYWKCLMVELVKSQLSDNERVRDPLTHNNALFCKEKGHILYSKVFKMTGSGLDKLFTKMLHSPSPSLEI